MLSSIFGLPAHPLLVHATVVVIPVAALTVLLATVGVVAWRYSGTRATGGRAVPRRLQIATVAVPILAAAGTLVWVVLVGHSGGPPRCGRSVTHGSC